MASLDIETEGLTGRLYSIAVAAADPQRVFMGGAGPGTELIIFFEDEYALLSAFLEHLQELDPDLILGWNVVEFNLALRYPCV